MNENEISSAVGEYLGQSQSDEKIRLRESMGVAMKSQPDFEAEIQNVSLKTGVPLETARAMPEEVKAQAKMQELDVDDLAVNFPKASKFLSEPKNAVVSSDDIGVIKTLENSWGAFKSGIEKGSLQDDMSELLYKDLNGEITPAEAKRLELLQAQMSDVEKASTEQTEESKLAYFLNQTGYAGRQMVTSVREGAKGGAAGAAAGAGAALAIGQLGPQVALPEELVTVPGAAIAGGRYGFLAGSAWQSYKAESGFAWDEFKAIRDESGQPIDPGVAKGAAKAVGVLNAGLDVIGEQAIMNLFPGLDKLTALGPKAAVRELLRNQTTAQALSSFGKNWVKAATIEGLTEGIQELSVILGGEVAKLGDGGQFESVDVGQAASRVGQSAQDAFVGSLGLGAAGGAANQVQLTVRDKIEARKMEQNATLIKAIGDTAKESKLLERMPEKYKELVSTIKEGGPVENVFIAADQFTQYFQSKGVDPAIVAQEIGATNFQEAVAAGSDIMVPIESYASTIAKTEHHDALAQDIRFYQSDKTLREYAESLQQKQEQQAKLKEMAEAELQTEQQLAAASEIQAKFKENLVQVGTDPSTAEAYATSYARAMVTLATRSGMDPMQLAERYGLTVSRPMPGVISPEGRADISIDPILDLMRSGDQGKITAQVQDKINAIKPYLDNLGIDLGTIKDNATIRKMIEQASGNLKNLMSARMPSKDLKDQIIFDITNVDTETGSLIFDDTGPGAAQVKTRAAGYTVAADYVKKVMDEFSASKDDLQELARRIEADEKLSAKQQELYDALKAGAEAQNKQRDESDYLLQFAGRKSATAQFDKLVRAASMENKGSDMETIRKETGWFKGQDNRWRYEISDENAKPKDIQIKSGKTYKLGDLIDHKELFDAYPQLKDVNVNIGIQRGSSGGSFNRTKSEINLLIAKYPAGLEKKKDELFDIEQTKVFKDFEVKFFNARTKVMRNAAWAELNATEEGKRRNELHKELYLNKDKAVAPKKLDKAAVSTLLHEVQHAIQHIEGFANGAAGKSSFSGTSSYYNTLGEVEARDAQNRQSMSADDRKNTPPSQMSWKAPVIKWNDVVKEMPIEDMPTELVPFVMGEQMTLFQSNKNNNTNKLIVQHNLTDSNLRFAKRMGGLAVPSLAVTTVDTPLTNFGEITLIGSKDLIDPKKSKDSKVFGADIYSPRYPDINYKIPSKRVNDLIKKLTPYFKKVGDDRSLYRSNDLSKEGPAWLENKSGVMLAFVEEKGIEFTPLKDEDGNLDDYLNRRELRNLIQEKNLSGEYQAFVDATFRSLDPEEKLFAGFTNMGDRRYKAHTIDNVVSMLKKELRGGEGFNYGVGSLRAKFTPQFKSIKQLKENQEKLVSKEEFDNIKDEIDKEFFKVVEQLAPFHSNSKSFGFTDTVIAVMEDAVKMGVPRALDEYGFNEVSQDAQKEIAKFLEKLRTLPTAYFEAKLLRAVGIYEFQGAVIPKNTSQEARDILKRSGLDVREYSDEEGREQAIKDLANDLNVLFQEQNEEDAKGYIQFGKDRKMSIALLEKADLSTLIHELGHFYLEVMQDLAMGENAPDQMKQDFQTLLNWFGVTEEQWNGFNLEQRREYHEQFARAHEAYLMEGKAPSEELRSIFSKFRDWLKFIYRQITALNVRLNDDVREVFDRIYATDDEIIAARKEVPIEVMFATAKDAGMSEAEFAVYAKAAQKQIESAKEALQTKLMKEMKREKEAWWKEAKAKMTDEVTAEVSARPEYRALEALKEGKIGEEPVKLNKKALQDKYGKEFTRRIPSRTMTKDGGMDAETAAAFLGYESGDKLIEDIVSAKPIDQVIKAEVDKRMVEKHGDMMLDMSMVDEAKIALHNQDRESVLMTELKAINKKRREAQPFVRAAMQNQKDKAQAALDVPPKEFFRETATEIVNNKAVKDLQPYAYLRAQRKAAKEAFENMGKGNFELAKQAKERELLNHHLYIEATKAKEEADKIYEYARKFDKSETRQRIGKAGGDYLQQIDAILDRYEFRRIPLSKLEKRRSLLDWVLEQESQGLEPAIDESILDEARNVNYKEITLSELRAVRDSVKNIEHLARLKNKLIFKQNQVEFADAVGELVAAANLNGNNVKVPLDPNARSFSEKFKDGVIGIVDAPLIKMEQMVEWLDGGNIEGPWHKYLWNPIAEAQFAEHDLSKMVTSKIVESLEKMPAEQRKSMLDTYDVPGMGNVTKKYIMSIAFNMGNQENIDKMMKGHNWSMTTIEAALQNLNAADWQFVQETWDTINELWPQIAELEKKMSGVVPPKVEAKPYVAYGRDGEIIAELKGGYFPLAYDPRFSEQGAKQEGGDVSQMFEQGYVRATTQKGHTKARTVFAAPLMLDFEHVVTSHLTKVIKDLTHREAIVAANKVITNKEVRSALQTALGVQYEKQFLPWLRSVVNDRNAASTQGVGELSRFMLTMRANVVAATMGFKATTAIAQVVGLSQSLDKVKGRYLSRALTDFLKHPVKVSNEVREMSGEIRYRAENLDRDIRGRLQQLINDNSAYAKAQKFAFHGIALADSIVAVPTWLGAYRQAIDEGRSRDAAILEADAAVRLTQGAGGAKDLSAVQRSNEMMKLITMFYSYFNVLYNRMRDMGREVQDIRDMPKFLSRAFFTVAFPAVMGELILGRGPDEDEDEAWWVVRKVMAYPAMSIPLLRDIVASMESGYDYRFTPMATGLEKISKLAVSTGKLAEGEMEWGDYATKATSTIGYVAGIPGTAQITASSKYLWRVAEGEENPDNIAELIGYTAMGKKAEK